MTQQPARRRRQLVPDLEPKRLPVGQDLGRRRSSGCQRPAVGGQCENRGPSSAIIDGVRGLADVGFQKLFRRGEVEIVSDVEDMRDEGNVDRVRIEPDVEVAERDRMRGGAQTAREASTRAPRARPEATHDGPLSRGRSWSVRPRINAAISRPAMVAYLQ